MTVKTDVTAPLREAFAQRTDTSPDDWFCTFKARYGMREAFSAVRDVAGDGRVLTTLFTGCTAVDSILAAGMGVGYATIDGATLSVDAALLEVGPEVRAVLLQNSYGMVDEAVTRTIADKAHAAGAILVEDSAHCLSRMARDADGRPVADVSIHSFGIEKTFSDIYFGGALWVNPAMADAALHDAIVARLRSCAELPARLGRACASYRTHARILAHLPGALSGVAKSVLLRTGSYEPPVADVERRGGLPYPSYLPNEWVVQRILPRFATLDEDEARRREASLAYAELLGDEFSGRIPAAALASCKGQPLLRFPSCSTTRRRPTRRPHGCSRAVITPCTGTSDPSSPARSTWGPTGSRRTTRAWQTTTRASRGSWGSPRSGAPMPPARRPASWATCCAHRVTRE